MPSAARRLTGRRQGDRRRRPPLPTLAQHIAASIRTHAACGETRTVDQYTHNPELAALVRQLLEEETIRD